MSEWTRPAQPVRCVVELDKPLAVHRERGVLAQGDANANAIVAEVYSTAGKPYDLTGCTVQLIFVRPDNNALPAINAEISGNTATATLPDSAYAMSGMYSLRMQLRKNGAERTIVWIIGEVKGTDVDGIADPEHVISIGDIMASAKEAQTAASNANAAAQRANAGAERAEQLKIDASGLAGDSNKLGGKTPSYYLPAVDLLINGYFRGAVNQRCQTIYTGNGNKPVYAIDGWYTWGVGATLTVNSDSITIAGGPFRQNVPLSCFESGKTYTYAIKEKNGTLRIVNAKYGYDVGSAASKIYMEWVGSNGIGYRVNIYPGELEWAVLYEGTYTADTMPPYVPNKYAAELLECQRHCIVYETNSTYETVMATGYTDSSFARFSIDLAVPMRIGNPSIAADSGIVFGVRSNGKYTQASSVTIHKALGKKLYLQANGAFDSGHVACLVYYTNVDTKKRIVISADIQ